MADDRRMMTTTYAGLAQHRGRRRHVGDPIDIDDYLREAGFTTGAALQRARGVLEQRGLTNPRKQGFSREKRASVDAALASLARACSGACADLLRVRGDKREIIRLTRAGCEVCNGSNNQRAVAECISALRRKKMRKIVIVGGSPGQRNDVRQYFEGAGVDIRFVDGTSASHGAKEAERNKMWAQLIVIWGPTPLRHAVSNRYTEERYEGLKVVTVPRRGIEALCAEVVRAVG